MKAQAPRRRSPQRPLLVVAERAGQAPTLTTDRPPDRPPRRRHPTSYWLVNFTNKAAREMKDQTGAATWPALASSQFGSPYRHPHAQQQAQLATASTGMTKELWIGTSMPVRALLRYDIDKYKDPKGSAGPSSSSIYDESEPGPLVKKIVNPGLGRIPSALKPIEGAAGDQQCQEPGLAARW